MIYRFLGKLTIYQPERKLTNGNSDLDKFAVNLR